jgi:hypothetical protein
MEWTAAYLRCLITVLVSLALLAILVHFTQQRFVGGTTVTNITIVRNYLKLNDTLEDRL